MGYYLEAVVAAEPLLRAAAADLPDAHVVPLRQGLALIPMTDALHDALTDPVAERLRPFQRLPRGFQHTLAAWSADGPVAYVEADIWGGTGDQYALAWTGGALTLGPLTDRTPVGPSAISRALRHLGVSGEGHRDEFDAVGLGRHRRTESWLTGDD
ncbi:hypothetical protein [Kitasatospora sp. NPDC090308]|uniref:hypothetical protein n=1 Tax=Kitasatospora sp. NPDC090308 TaxID=3364082 RepID=UPI003801B5E6